jgi:hypothetical protein
MKTVYDKVFKKLLSGLLNMMMDIKLSAHFQKDGKAVWDKLSGG